MLRLYRRVPANGLVDKLDDDLQYADERCADDELEEQVKDIV
jgi:hypothetical protein